MAQTSSPGTQEGPPFATVTLARLYLAQGHVERAEGVVRELRAQGAGEDVLWGVEQELARLRDERRLKLESLLQRVQANRR